MEKPPLFVCTTRILRLKALEIKVNWNFQRKSKTFLLEQHWRTFHYAIEYQSKIKRGKMFWCSQFSQRLRIYGIGSMSTLLVQFWFMFKWLIGRFSNYVCSFTPLKFCFHENKDIGNIVLTISSFIQYKY